MCSAIPLLLNSLGFGEMHTAELISSRVYLFPSFLSFLLERASDRPDWAQTWNLPDSQVLGLQAHTTQLSKVYFKKPILIAKLSFRKLHEFVCRSA